MEIIKLRKFTKEDVDFLNCIGIKHDTATFVFYTILLGLQWPDGDDSVFYATRWFSRKLYYSVVNNRRFFVKLAKKILKFNQEECERFKFEHYLSLYYFPDSDRFEDLAVVV